MNWTAALTSRTLLDEILSRSETARLPSEEGLDFALTVAAALARRPRHEIVATVTAPELAGWGCAADAFLSVLREGLIRGFAC